MLGGQRDQLKTQWAARTNGSRWPRLNLPSCKNTPSVSIRGSLCLCLTVIWRFCIIEGVSLHVCDAILQQSCSRWHTEWHSDLKPEYLRTEQSRRTSCQGCLQLRVDPFASDKMWQMTVSITLTSFILHANLHFYIKNSLNDGNVGGVVLSRQRKGKLNAAEVCGVGRSAQGLGCCSGFHACGTLSSGVSHAAV